MRQSFSHGRSKQVVVEKVKRRVIGAPARRKPESAAASPRPKRAAAKMAEPRPRRNGSRPAAAPKSGVVLRTLTEDERTARAQRAGRCARARGRRTQDRRRRSAPPPKPRGRRPRRPRSRRSAQARRGRAPPPRGRCQAQGRTGSQEAFRRGQRSNSRRRVRPSKPRRTTDRAIRVAAPALAPRGRPLRRKPARADRSKAARPPDARHGA